MPVIFEEPLTLQPDPDQLRVPLRQAPVARGELPVERLDFALLLVQLALKLGVARPAALHLPAAVRLHRVLEKKTVFVKKYLFGEENELVFDEN